MAMHDNTNLTALVDEYRTFADESGNGEGVPDWGPLTARLIAEGQWTEHGAHHLVELVQTYGSFVLRNAAALAIATEVEDGTAGL